MHRTRNVLKLGAWGLLSASLATGWSTAQVPAPPAETLPPPPAAGPMAAGPTAGPSRAVVIAINGTTKLSMSTRKNLRQVVNEKNRQFFFRWRAVNGEYIYGRRKTPFGVVSFPPEMKKLDEMILDLDGKIWTAAQAPHTQSFELNRNGQ